MDSVIMISSSPLERLKANLDSQVAPKHLPCRQAEYKSLHCFLVRKMNESG